MIIFSSVGTYASWQVQEDKIKDNYITVLDLENGVFSAKIGKEKNEDPIYYLDGSYQVEDKIISCDGNIISGDEEGKFFCIFKGDYFELKIIFEEKPMIISGKYKFDKNKEDFQGAWFIDGKDECFEFVYPITYIMPDGSTITVENEDDWDEIKNWYGVNPDVEEKPELQYPVDIIFQDGTIKTINNEEEMKSVYEYCNDKITGWITGTFQGMEDDDKEKNITYIFEKFPMFKKLLKIPIFQRILNKF